MTPPYCIPLAVQKGTEIYFEAYTEPEPNLYGIDTTCGIGGKIHRQWRASKISFPFKEQRSLPIELAKITDTLDYEPMLASGIPLDKIIDRIEVVPHCKYGDSCMCDNICSSADKVAVIKPEAKEIMTQEKAIELIKGRIMDEYRKHPNLDWAEIAARKLYSQWNEFYNTLK